MVPYCHYNYYTKDKRIGFTIDYNHNNTIDIYEIFKPTEMPNLNTTAFLLSTLLIPQRQKTFKDILEETLSDKIKDQYTRKKIILNDEQDTIIFSNTFTLALNNNDLYYGYNDYLIYYILRFIIDHKIVTFIKSNEHDWMIDHDIYV